MIQMRSTRLLTYASHSIALSNPLFRWVEVHITTNLTFQEATENQRDLNLCERFGFMSLLHFATVARRSLEYESESHFRL